MGGGKADVFSGNYGCSYIGVEKELESADTKYLLKWAAKDGYDSSRTVDDFQL